MKDNVKDYWREKPKPVCEKNEFIFSAAGLSHDHIYGMCRGLIEAGAALKSVYDPDLQKMEKFKRSFPGVQMAQCLDEILNDQTVQLVACAAIPSKRSGLGERVMKSGKDYFTDKAPFTSLCQLEQTKKTVQETKVLT